MRVRVGNDRRASNTAGTAGISRPSNRKSFSRVYRNAPPLPPLPSDVQALVTSSSNEPSKRASSSQQRTLLQTEACRFHT